VVERGMSNFYWDSNSIPAARTVTRCYDWVGGKIRDQCNIILEI
jgi:hypothetical protein